jgi:hypothetical protein
MGSPAWVKNDEPSQNRLFVTEAGSRGSGKSPMKPEHALGMVCGYYISRLDEREYMFIRYDSQDATHRALG